MINRHLICLVFVCFAERGHAQGPCSETSRARHPLGILIGLNSEDAGDPSDSLPADSSTLVARGLAVFREDTVWGFTVRSVNSTDRADPLSSLWILACDGRVTTRQVQHVVVPRRNGFWRLGMNTSSAELVARSPQDSTVAGTNTAEMNFFWVARLNEAPRLRSLDPHDLTCVALSDAASLTYVGPDFVASTVFGQSTCAHYDESHHMRVEALDSIHAAGTAAPGAQSVALLGPAVVALHRRLNDAARHWTSDCGERGFESNPTEWTIRREAGSWIAVANFAGTGGGICGRYNEERRLRTGLPRALGTPASRLTVGWSAIAKAVPGAVDASESPDSTMVVVLAPGRIVDRDGRLRPVVTILRVEHGALRRIENPIGVGGPWVMLEWAAGERALEWNSVISTLPVLRDHR